MATHTGHVMNLANSIIGVSLLAMPFCFKQCGIALGIIMLMLSSIISKLACHFLVKSSTMCRRRSFEFLAFYTFGPSGKLLVELGVIGFMMGTCVAFFVVMGDLGPAIISKIFNISNSGTLRTIVLIGLGFLVVLPLGLLRNVESLAAISTVTIGFYLLFILKIFFESLPHLLNGDWWYHVNFWKPEGILQCIPIFAMALSCQTQLFEIYESLPMPTIEKMNSVVRSALNLCTIVYASVGFLGYIAYCKGNFTGNILLSFAPSLSSEMFKLGFVMSIAVSFPLVIFPCRASLFSLLFKRVPIHHELSQTGSHIPDSRFKCLTVGIVLVALVTGLLIPSIELVLGFVGSTIGIAICVLFPSLSFLNLYNKNTNERLTAKFTLFMGLVIMIMGTFGNLFAAVENRGAEPSLTKEAVPKSLPQLKIPPLVEVSTESAKSQNKEVLVANPVVAVKSSEGVKPKVKITENRLKQPPIPVAPAINEKKAEKLIAPQVHVLETNLKIEREKESSKVFEKEKTLQEVKLSENINKDAIEKENREIMEVEKQKKTEEDEKQEELLKRLKKHQDEQKKLLREQENILKEIKSRESEKKANELIKEKFSLKTDSTLIKEMKTDGFGANIKEIQNFIQNLKETKNTFEKERVVGKNVSFGLSKAIEESKDSKGTRQGQPPAPVEVPEEAIGKNLLSSVPLPLVKVSDTKKAEVPSKDPPKSKQEVLARDILVKEKEEKSLGREKRGVVSLLNAAVEECDPKERETSEKTERKNTNEDILIKNSEHLSVDLKIEEKPKMSDEQTPSVFSDAHPLVSKKRDLKSVTYTVRSITE